MQKLSNRTLVGVGTLLAVVTSITMLIPIDSSAPLHASAPPGLSIAKTDDHETAAPGDILTYIITISNASHVKVIVDIKDTFSSSTTFLSASDQGKYKPSKGTVVWKGLKVPARGSRSITLQIKVNEDAGNGIVISNTVAVGNLTATDTTTVEVPQQTGNLYVTQSTTPLRPRQLLGGELGEAILRLTLRAEHEGIDVTRLVVFTDTGGDLPASVARLELFRPGEATRFAIATIDNCAGNPVNAYCAEMQSQQLVVPEGETVDVLVRPLMKTDEQGAVSTELIQLELRGNTAALARGFVSSNTLAVNDGDTIAEGEIFIGTSTPQSNAPIVGNPNDVVLSKIITIENVNPDADGTNVPVGTNKRIAEFKFTGAVNSNTLNARNRAILEEIVLDVTSSNVLFASDSFDLYNKNDQTQKIRCGTTGTTGHLFALCRKSVNPAVNLEVTSGGSVTLVLEADIISNQVSSIFGSTLQVSIANFSDRSKMTFGANDSDSHVHWLDSDGGASASFRWIENDNAEIPSTAYDL
ncbi:MAG: hypothetical protein AAB853_04265 [Patescibacteria group bacterium]